MKRRGVSPRNPRSQPGSRAWRILSGQIVCLTWPSRGNHSWLYKKGNVPHFSHRWQLKRLFFKYIPATSGQDHGLSLGSRLRWQVLIGCTVVSPFISCSPATSSAGLRLPESCGKSRTSVSGWTKVSPWTLVSPSLPTVFVWARSRPLIHEGVRSYASPSNPGWSWAVHSIPHVQRGIE